MLRNCLALAALAACVAIGTTGAAAAEALAPKRCHKGVSRAGAYYAPSRPLFDGVEAIVTPLSAYRGLTGTEHVGGLVGIGGKTYAAATVAGYAGDPVNSSRYQYEWQTGGYSNYRDALDFAPIPVGFRHVVRIERVSGDLWRFTLDGRAPRDHGLVRLGGSAAGLPHPRVYLSDENETLPCDNHGAARFEQVLAREHGSKLWRPLLRGTLAIRDTGERLRVLGYTAFSARTAS